MKIHGSGPPKGSNSIKPKAVESKDKSEQFSSVLQGSPKESQGPSAKAGLQHGQSSSSVLSPNKIQEITDKIRAGKLNQAEATELFVREVVAAQLGEAAKGKVGETVVNRVRDIVKEDPFLSKQLEALVGGREGDG
jgi:hypothetical protein